MKETALTEGGRDASVWPPFGVGSKDPRPPKVAKDDGSHDEVVEVPDPAGDHQESLWVDGIMQPAYGEVVRKLWLSQDDVVRRILEMHYASGYGFKAIAAELGAGWTEIAVRSRHHRFIKRAKHALQTEGLI